VPPLRLRQARVEERDAVAEARAEAAKRLRGESDLGDEHDRAATRGEGGLAGADVDLGLAAAGGAGEEDVAAAPGAQLLDPSTRSAASGSMSGGASASASTTTPRRRELPKGIERTAPFSTSSSISYVNGRARARALTIG